MSEQHAISRELFVRARRNTIEGGRATDGIGVRDLLVALASMLHLPDVAEELLAGLDVPGLTADRLKWPPVVRADLERSRNSRDLAESDLLLPVTPGLASIIDAASEESRRLAPPDLIPAALSSAHPLILEFHWINGSRKPVATPLLDKCGTDLTREARAGHLGPVVGREDLVEQMAITLCRSIKRNPLLVGPAGVGKTAVVEELARWIADGRVPPQLRGARVIELRPSKLLASSDNLGAFISTVEGIVREASQPGVILFVDEVHSMVGAGGFTGKSDMASLLKPALGRGAIACIAATTDYEYLQYFADDRALNRRFEVLHVEELSAEKTYEVLRAHRDSLTKYRDIEVEDGVLRWIVGFAERNMRNRRFPDKAIDILDKCVAAAAYCESGSVSQQDAEEIALDMVSVPERSAESLSLIIRGFCDRGLLIEADAERLATRLAVTMGGFDVRPARPNAVLLMTGEAVDVAQQLGVELAEEVLGAESRLTTIELADFSSEYDLPRLIGSAPGLVGYGKRMPIHRLLEMPTCVLLLRNADKCHWRVQEFLASALERGVFRDGTGRSIYLSDAVVVLTAGHTSVSHSSFLGFASHPSASPAKAAVELGDLEDQVGSRLLEQVDLIVSTVGETRSDSEPASRRVWRMLEGLSSRHRIRGVDLVWDESVLAWLEEQARDKSVLQVERLIDDEVGPLLVAQLSESSDHSSGATVRTLRIGRKDNALTVCLEDGSEDVDEAPT